MGAYVGVNVGVILANAVCVIRLTRAPAVRVNALARTVLVGVGCGVTSDTRVSMFVKVGVDGTAVYTGRTITNGVCVAGGD